MKKVIGIVSLWDDNKSSMWLLPEYADGISKVGGLPIILPLTTNYKDILQMVTMCDGFLFTGGHDVNTKMYHEEPIAQCGAFCNIRDIMEKIIFEYALKEDKSILGICRGIQLINVLCGGTLYQDLNTQYKSKINHVQQPPYHISQHKARVLNDTPLYDILRKSIIEVNSYHHQAIKDLGSNLKVSAISEDGLIEGIYMEDKNFIQAVQFHPEFSYAYSVDSIRIFEAFVKSC